MYGAAQTIKVDNRLKIDGLLYRIDRANTPLHGLDVLQILRIRCSRQLHGMAG
jgi:hypothetical protein